MICTCPTASDYSTSHLSACPWHRQFGGSSQRAHTGGHPITETTCDDWSCWCRVGINATRQQQQSPIPAAAMESWGGFLNQTALGTANPAAGPRRLEREYWERVHLACLTNCAENAEEIADKAVSAWRERWAKERA